MCLAVPGKIVSIKNGIATVDYDGETRHAHIIEDSFLVDDYVIVQGGIVVEKIPPEEAREAIENYRLALTSRG